MMINKRLIAAVPDCKSHIAANMAFQWLSLIANIAMMAAIAHFLGSLAIGSLNNATIGISLWFCSCTGPFPSPSPVSLPSTFSFSERSWHNKKPHRIRCGLLFTFWTCERPPAGQPAKLRSKSATESMPIGTSRWYHKPCPTRVSSRKQTRCWWWRRCPKWQDTP